MSSRVGSSQRLASARPIGHGLLDADGFMALGALAEAVTGAIHLVPWPKPTYSGQFWPFHAVSIPQAGQLDHPLNA